MTKLFLLLVTFSFIFISCTKNNDIKKPKNSDSIKTNQIPQNNSSISNTNYQNIPEGKYLIRLKFIKYKKYEIYTNMIESISQTLKGQKQDMTQSINFKYIFNILDVDKDGNANIEITYKRILLEANQNKEKITFDSDSPKKIENPAFKGFSALVNQHFIAKMSNSGKIIKIDGALEMIKNMLKRFDIKDKKEYEAALQSLSQQFGDKTLKDNIENIFSIYPEKPVGQNDVWSRKTSVNLGLPLIVSTEFKFATKKDNVYQVNTNSVITPDPELSKGEVNGVNVKYEVKGKQSGSMQFSSENGWLNYASMKRNVSGNILMEKVDTKEKMSIPFSLYGKTEFKLKEIN